MNTFYGYIIYVHNSIDPVDLRKAHKAPSIAHLGFMCGSPFACSLLLHSIRVSSGTGTVRGLPSERRISVIDSGGGQEKLIAARNIVHFFWIA